MNVAELIEFLKTLPPDFEVEIYDGYWNQTYSLDNEYLEVNHKEKSLTINT